MSYPNTLTQTLHEHGLRLTPQRRLVLEILKDSNEHLDAEGIWLRAQKKDKDINLATVYRALNTLVEIGLVQNSYLGGNQKRAFFEMISKPEHVHFACLECGRVLELGGEAFSQVQRDFERLHAIKIKSVYLKFEGLCADCVGLSLSENLTQEV